MEIKFTYRYLLFIFLLCLPLCTLAFVADSTQIAAVDNVNKQAYKNRLVDPNETIKQANKALTMANKITYQNGIGEAYRVLGIGNFYLNKIDTAYLYYTKALKVFEGNKNIDEQGKVINNIGSLYRESDYEIAIDYYNKALGMAQQVKDEDLIATIYLNFGNIYYKKKAFQKALDYYNKSNVLFTKLNNVVNLIQCLQNKGVIYFNLDSLDKAETLLLEANRQAKEKDLNIAVASINLTLTSVFKAKGQFDKAGMYLDEGVRYSQLVNSKKLQYDYKETRYELELKRKNWKAALNMLQEIFRDDSIKSRSDVSTRISLLKVQDDQRETEFKNTTIQAQQKTDRILFWATLLVASLLVVLVVVLVNNVNRKAKTNADLTRLNEKVTEQKENLNQINHHLEEIIDDRTKDLQIKNKKLADYSLHLSHQIRGPIATLKGLLNLEKDDLIEKEECIKLMNKCVSEIDDNIIDMSGMLHETAKTV